MERVVLVDQRGQPVGTAPKLAAHEPPGQLHLAFSVVVFHPDGRVLLQRRAEHKHHFAGRWSNTACSHPRPGEAVDEAGRRRLREEMGMEAGLAHVGSFTYRAEDPVSGLIEHELDHVLVGTSDAVPQPDLGEVSEWAWADPADLASRIAADPASYTPWFAQALDLAVGGRGGDRAV